MQNPISAYLNNTVMYRLMRHVLGAVAVVAISFGFLGWVPFSGLDLLLTLIVLIAVCWGANWLLAKVFSAPVNPDSAVITALILFFLVFPSSAALLITGLVGLLAMSSKYILTWRKRHIFNPAAAGAVIAGLFGVPIFWWVATPILFPFVLLAGLMIVQKTQRHLLVMVFVVCAALSVVFIGTSNDGQLLPLLRQAFLSWPIIFFATVMLTEPMTMPAKRHYQLLEALVLGGLFAVPFHVGPLYASPELILLIGNLFSFAVSHKATVRLTLVERNEPSPGVLDLGFTAERPLHFEPGQYVEWTLPHDHVDARGARRTFTVASAPGERLVRIGVRLAKEKGSSFKRALAALPIGGALFASNVGGEFTLPKDAQQKLVFIAGGIGITPFRSFVQTMIDQKTTRDAILFYCAASESDFVYQPIFKQAAAHGLTAHYLTDRLSEEIIRKQVPDFADRVFYLSGPPKMVDSYKKLLRTLRVSRRQIRTDYFPGY